MGMDNEHHGGSACRWDSVVTNPSMKIIDTIDANMGSNIGVDEENRATPSNEEENLDERTPKLRRRSVAALHAQA